MSDAEESVETEKEEEEDNPNHEEENLQQSLTGDTLSWEESQEMEEKWVEEEEQIEGKEKKGEEEGVRGEEERGKEEEMRGEEEEMREEEKKLGEGEEDLRGKEEEMREEEEEVRRKEDEMREEEEEVRGEEQEMRGEEQEMREEEENLRGKEEEMREEEEEVRGEKQEMRGEEEEMREEDEDLREEEEEVRGEEEEMRGEEKEMRGEEEEMRGEEKEMRGEEEEMREEKKEMRGEEEEMREEKKEMRGEEEEMRGGEKEIREEEKEMRSEEEEMREEGKEMRGEEKKMREEEKEMREEEMREEEMREEEKEMRAEEKVMRAEEKEMREEEKEMRAEEKEMREEEKEMREEEKEMREEEKEMRGKEEEMREKEEEVGEEEEKRWEEKERGEEEKGEGVGVEKAESKENGGEEEDKERGEEEHKGEGQEGKEEGKERSGKGEEEGGTVIKETEKQIGSAGEAGAKKPPKRFSLDDIIISSESSTSASSLIITSGSSKSSSHSPSPEVSEIFRDRSTKDEITEAAAVESEEAEIDSRRGRSSKEVKEETGQEADVSAQGRRDRGADQKGAEAAREKAESGELAFLLTEEARRKSSQLKPGVPEESMVSTSTEDTLFQKEEASKVYPLTMTWSFGWNSFLPVYYLRENQRVILYVCAHTAVIYNVFRNTQYHLQGHPNIISCLCVSEDRRWIATADKGPDCLIIIWDSFTGIPVHTIFDSCPEGNGIRSIAITHDAKLLATISDAEIQKVCIWKWTLAVETPACTLELPKEYGFQNYLTFNPANNRELVSNSKTQAVYYSWLEEKGILAHSAPILTEKTFNKLVGKFSQSVFHLKLAQILSATKEGKLVVWDIHRRLSSSSVSAFPFIKPRKLVHLQKEGITVLTTVDNYIVTGDVKGNIKFYDHTLSVVNWYSNFKLGAIRTLSFSKSPVSPPTEKSNLPTDCTLKGDLFIVRNFIIGTFDATVYHMTTDGTKLEKLFVEPRDAVYAISCHPYQPLIAVGSVCGMIKVWDYEKKVYLFSRTFEKGLGVQSLSYNPEGALLGAGFTEGTVYILDAMSLENESPEPFRYSRTSVSHVSFSHDSNYMATADVSFTVAVYMVVVKNGQRVWEYLARLRSHHNSIRSLLFGVHLDSNEPRLLSLGKDRFLIEYNLIKSYKDHLVVLDIHRTDQGSYPTCMIWYPPLTKELFLLICNSCYKVKLFNSTTKMCRKTLLGPAYGSPIEHTQVLPVRSTLELQKRYLVFINKDKVGLQILPVDGNPHKTCAIVCHPNGVAGMALSYDGRYAFTAGGKDCSVVQWEINLSALEAAVSLGGEDLTPFYGLVSGGREGKFYRELEDYFYYSQIRSQGIDTMETRQVSEHICLSELPFVMRAIGFYPSEEKIEDMFNEIKFSEYVDTGKLIDKINLPDFLKVYLNHRPPFGNTMTGIQESFNVLGFTNSQGKKAIRREDFLNLLLTKGEHMTEEEMYDCFATLFGLNPEGWKSEPAATSIRDSEICLEEELPDEITAEIFATEILGLAISNSSGQLDQ